MRNYQVISLDINEWYFEKVIELFCFVFSQGNQEDAKERITKHAGYDGFNGLVAVTDEEVLGFSYGYTSQTGQFYNTKLRKEMTEKQAQEWLSDCFEFVELVVDKRQRRMGIATSLHDELLRDLSHTTSILTTQVDNKAARTLYERKDWQIIKEPFYPFAEPFVIMGKKLR